MEQQIGLQRVGVMSRLPQILWDLGVDPREVFSAAGLPPASIADPDASISFDELDRLFSWGVSLGRCPHLALLVGNQSSLRFLGPVGELMRHAPTGRRALLDLVENHHRIVRGAVVHFVDWKARRRACGSSSTKSASGWPSRSCEEPTSPSLKPSRARRQHKSVAGNRSGD